MRFFFVSVWLLGMIMSATGQTLLVQSKASLPQPLTNTAIATAKLEGKDYIYAFGGLGQSKTHESITLSSYRFNLQENKWQAIPSLPDTLGKVAAAASTVKNKIYIIGGYHVFADGHERSSDKVHVFDPEKNKFLEDATAIPVPIDDHVQTVWRDSLIFVISGWSDKGNVRDVQIFNPARNEWKKGTSLPETKANTVFGASGVIVGDTIYFAGGAGNYENKNFPMQEVFHKGYINSDNPTDIQWEEIKEEKARLYRSAALEMDGKVIWFGGASKSYNYNGIAYTGEKVEPLVQMLIYDPANGNFETITTDLPAIMDLRGAAKINDNQFIISGGIREGQQVSDQTWLITIRK